MANLLHQQPCKRPHCRFWLALASILVMVALPARHALPQPVTGTGSPVAGAAQASKLSEPAVEFQLDLPIDCLLDQNCHVLAYVDALPGPMFQDFSGGRQTYDGHDGTDFALADQRAMQRGVAVKAAAAGRVVRVRDGVADKRVANPQQAKAISPTGCGNAVVIDHTPEWRTYYCHLRNGSLLVKPGMRVEKGAALGLVGLSGLSSYPHVHFGVLHKGKPVDPFVGLTAGKDMLASRKPLWETPVRYLETGLISAGFSNQREDSETVWQGLSSTRQLTTAASSIVFWVHPFGVLAGDLEQIRLLAPDGSIASESHTVIASPNRINRVSWVGKRNTVVSPLGAGIWRGQYQLRRGDRLLIDATQEVAIANPDGGGKTM